MSVPAALRSGIASNFPRDFGKAAVPVLRSMVPSLARTFTKGEAVNPSSYFPRHVGFNDQEVSEMLKTVGVKSVEELMDKTVPKSVRKTDPVNMAGPRTEPEVLAELKEIAKRNKVFKSYIGMGYYGTHTPSVILRNVLENPMWYTSYTPYQAEISQGRMEGLLHFQTMVQDLTALPVANASLLDEASAAGEAMSLCFAKMRRQRRSFFVSKDAHPQTISHLKTRAAGLGIKVLVGDHRTFDFDQHGKDLCGVMMQYPNTYGSVQPFDAFIEDAHRHGVIAAVGTDLLGLTIMRPPGEFGADIAFGTTQRFGVPMGFGGPAAAFFASSDALKRVMPGRFMGITRDAQGNAAVRMTLQTREQHIRRETASSNICTAQALLANIAGFYSIYHGPEGLRAIADRTHKLACTLRDGAQAMGHQSLNDVFFDTLSVQLKNTSTMNVVQRAVAEGMNMRPTSPDVVGIALDETTTPKDVEQILGVLDVQGQGAWKRAMESKPRSPVYGTLHERRSEYMTHPVFHTYHSEHEMLRFIQRLANRDFSLANGMIPLGSCTMKLNATSVMIPVTWPEFGQMHPFAPLNQAEGYQELIKRLSKQLMAVTELDAVSLQPNSGATGEHAGLLVIHKYHQARGDTQREICLIPASAHGTNPASAVMAGFKCVTVKCDKEGNISLVDLHKKIDQHKDKLAALMVTYPSTHGVFEEEIKEMVDATHAAGGLVYFDGANLNAQIGWTSPGRVGADVCHVNLHKTLAIPHGGGGPGVGPICVGKHLEPYLPSHPVVDMGLVTGEHRAESIGNISAAPWGSASVLPISYVFMEMLGGEGVKKTSEMAVLAANYMRKRLEPYYRIMYTGKQGMCGHEFIVDLKEFKKVGIVTEDVSKRLVDYGHHAPTNQFPVHDSLMVEPTESESKNELDRYCDSLIAIREEIREVEEGKVPKDNNALVNAPHTLKVLCADQWDRPYSREHAAFPAAHTRVANAKVFPSIGRIDNVYGDKNLFMRSGAPDVYTDPHKTYDGPVPVLTN